MTQTPEFAAMRLEGLSAWGSTTSVPQIPRAMFQGIFSYVLSKQQPSGEWNADGNLWNAVMTAVVVKSLAAVGYRPSDKWPNGGLEPALKYLSGLLRNRSTEKVGEDIWDACQVLLAMAAFDRHDPGVQHARNIVDDWQGFYDAAVAQRVRWCGPAYLAAMIELLRAYADHGVRVGQALEEITARLRSLEDESGGVKSGMFPANEDDDNMHRWNTSLVLRTLCEGADVDRDLVERCAGWLLGEWGKGLKKGGWEADKEEAPMFVARFLDALTRAKLFVTSATAARIDDAVESGHDALVAYWGDDPESRVGKLKSYTAVVEYLSSIRIPVPAGLILDVPSVLPTSGALKAGAAGSAENGNKVFIVHGRDMDTVRELQVFVSRDLELELPTVLADVRSGGSTVIEKFEDEAESVGLVFVLVTPDDVGRLATARDEKAAPRARQNVIFELGYFMRALGRQSGRVVVLKKGKRLEWLSDLGGFIPIDVDQGIEAAGEKIRREVKPFIDQLRAAQRAAKP
jgi:predicted nucleotide-binding protein